MKPESDESDPEWVGEALAFLMAMTLIAMVFPSPHARALASAAVFVLLIRLKGANPNLGGVRESVVAAALAAAVTIPILIPSRIEPTGLDPAILLPLLPYHLSVATWEEIVYRGYPLLRRSDFLLLTSSLMFSLIHAFNPGFGLQAFLGIFVAGLALGMIRISWGLVPAICMHPTWNVLMEHVWGFPTSGLLGHSLFRSALAGPDLMTGGYFGPEASPIVMIEFALIFAYLRFDGRR